MIPEFPFYTFSAHCRLHCIENHHGNKLTLIPFYRMLKEINSFVLLKINRIIKELKDRKKPQVWKPITTVNKSRSFDLLFANRTLLKNFDNFPPIIKVFLVTFNRYVNLGSEKVVSLQVGQVWEHILLDWWSLLIQKLTE